MKKAEKQEYVREVVAVGVFCGCAVRSLCIYERNRLCAFQRCMLKKENRSFESIR